MSRSLSVTPVSVIIPTYNRAGFLSQAIDSVISQTYPNFELIVVDDGSTDETPALLASYGKSLIVLRQENRGPAAARNAGIRAARHPLLAFLDSDDQFTRQKLALQVAAMEAEPELLISHTQETWFRNGLHLNQKKRHAKEGGDIFARSLALCVVGMSTVMARRELFDRIGLFDESFPCCEDYELWLRASVDHPFLLVDSPLTIKHGGRPDQVSVHFQTGMDRFRIRALEKLLSSVPLTQEQSRLAREELVRKAILYGNGCLKHGRREEGQRCLALSVSYSSPSV
ncbi:MAG: glycosyl transferase family A [Deltaproteobacteria bacterium RIFOXYD12_FULL_56_24]|nr:MAG: glycosyl transferase family A [Deltaproteobacteria bacterium RIFOXYD12_FULL_56_24]